MDIDSGISGRDREIKEIYKFISSRIEARKAGILYLTGPPGTGKTMSMDFVLDQIKIVPKVSLNCMRVQNPKVILTKICQAIGLKGIEKLSESELISRLAKKLTSRTCETHLIVLDEMDKLPKSKNVNIIKTIFSWSQETYSKLILVGIANTLTLTSRAQTLQDFTGEKYEHVKKIIFRPYNSADIKNILIWYLENDENFEDATVEQSALNIISKKFARENGDIRGALNALRGSVDDTMKEELRDRSSLIDDSTIIDPDLSSSMLTPPSTPPHTPKYTRQRTNIASVANSIKKRQKDSHYSDDTCPFPHQIILTCILKLSSDCKSQEAISSRCESMVERAFEKYSMGWSKSDFRAILDHLELQGLISVRKGRAGSKERLILKASECELAKLLRRKDIIMDLLNVC